MIENLVDTCIGKAGELNFRDRQETLGGKPDRDAGNRGFGQRRIEHTVRTKKLEKTIGGAKYAAVRPDVLVLCHGGPIAEPEDAEFILRHTHGVVGFFGASSIERLPTELAITACVRRFKALPIG